MLAGDINLNTGPDTMMYNNNMLDGLPFCNTDLSFDPTDH